MNKQAIQIKHEEFPHKNSPVSLTFEAEIKRIAGERCLAVGKLIVQLAAAAGVTERHLYNYRTGKSDIPSMLIPIFCSQFGSNALALALVETCIETEFDELELFDLGRFASRSVQDVLRGHDDFIDAFDDGLIDGHELTSLSLSTQKIIRNAARLLEVAQNAHGRRLAAAA